MSVCVFFQIWDTVKGQVQTEFADISSNDTDNFFAKPESKHLSMDYKCMKWLSLDKKVSLFCRKLKYFFALIKLLKFDFGRS